MSGWRAILEDALGHETYYLTDRAPAGDLLGVLPLVRVRSRLFGHYLISVPFLNYGGPLGDDASRERLCSEALSLARHLDVDLLEIRARDASPPGLNPASRKVTVLLPLPPSADELWEEGFRSKLRNKIKRPINHGMETRFGPAELEPFYEIFARNMRDLGTPVLSRRWFEAVVARLSDHVIFATVYWRNEPVAAGCGFLWQKEFELTWSSAIREHNSRHPNMLLCWSLMQETIRRGASCFNFGRSTPDSSTHSFKEQWGGHSVPLPWGSWGKRATPPNPGSTKYRLARSVWSRLPVPLSKRIGPRLARQLP
jgi:FemAB-related protein (PEP-CTERM system-associated)